MAAYAALVSLYNIMEQIRTHPRHSFSFEDNQMQSLREKVDFLLDFMENYSHGFSGEEAEALENQIREATHAAEDVVETHVVDQIHDGSSLNRESIPSTCFLVDLQKAIEDMDFVKEMAMEFKAQRGFRNQLPTYSRPAAAISSTGKDAMVGNDELIRLMEKLTEPQLDRRIIPIVGMGGIGKTTIARNVYEHKFVVQHYDVRLWATVSQEYTAQHILFELLSSQSGTVDELGLKLHKTLSGRRYLVILDDMWSIEAWDEVNRFFPDNDNGSHVAITTRQSNVAIHLSSDSFVVDFLDESNSWKLLCEKAFGDEGCPPELEEIGKEIAKKCKGLPLSVVVVGGHLGKSLRTKEYWEKVANDINAVLKSGDEVEQCFSILSLSYRYLPVHLKPCFLYLGVFPEDMDIQVPELIKVWVAEGFLKADKGQCLEEVARSYFRELVDRNLILVLRRRVVFKPRIVTFTIHDLLGELCTRIAEKEKFFCVVDNDTRAFQTERRVTHKGILPRKKSHPETFHALKSAHLARSLIWKTGEPSFHSRLLRVLYQHHLEAASTPIDAYIQQVNLRYFHYCDSGSMSSSRYLPSSISQLWNLQTLKLSKRVIVPSEIWEMSQLRHVEIEVFNLPGFLPSDRLNKQDGFILQNLQTLKLVENLRMSEEVCKRIPNVKTLHLLYLDYGRECEANSFYYPQNLGCFHKMELLHLHFSKPAAHWRDFVLSLTFPSSLRKLILRGCRLHWEDLTMIGLLPHLEVLELNMRSVVGHKWYPVENQFRRLKYLVMDNCSDLVCWNAERSHFPVLEGLFLYGVSRLQEIPSGIGEISTLAIIRLRRCTSSVAFSALKILVEQEELGNEDLHLQVSLDDEENRKFEEMMQLEGLTSNNLRLF